MGAGHQVTTFMSRFFKRVGVAAAFAGILGTAPAFALMPPYVYETARKEAASVIVIAVEKVEVPRKGFGNCAVAGTVKVVERGTAYTVGQAVTLAVSCAVAGATTPIGGIIWQPVEKLKASRFGRAYLDAAGAVAMSQYEQLAELP